MPKQLYTLIYKDVELVYYEVEAESLEEAKIKVQTDGGPDPVRKEWIGEYGLDNYYVSDIESDSNTAP